MPRGRIGSTASVMRWRTSVRGDGSARESAASLNGYSIIEAPDMEAAQALLKSHPLFEAGDEYTIEIYEVPRK
jgi:hypothetical protein